MNRLKTQRREVVRGLNNDREGATWQYQRGPRYGDNRKGVAKDKVHFRREDRLTRKHQAKTEIQEAR